MTVRVAFTRAQIRSAAIIAKDEGVQIDLNPDGSLSIVPTVNEKSVDVTGNDDLDRELEAFKVKHGYR